MYRCNLIFESEFFSKPCDMNIQCSCIAAFPVIPHALVKREARKSNTLIPQEKMQQLKFFRRQCYFSSRFSDNMCFRIEFNIPDAKQVVFLAVQPQNVFGSQKQFLNFERFNNVVIRTHAKCLPLVVQFPARGYEYHRY